MSDGRYVIDASALLCVLFDEPGAAYVAERLAGALVSAVNYQEVVAKLVDRGAPAADVTRILADIDLEVAPFDRHQAELAGLMRDATRNAGLSLGDRACLALARVHDGIALTTDKAWQRIGIGVEVELAR